MVLLYDFYLLCEPLLVRWRFEISNISVTSFRRLLFVISMLLLIFIATSVEGFPISTPNECIIYIQKQDIIRSYVAGEFTCD